MKTAIKRLVATLLGVAFITQLHAQPTAFTYQGRLNQGGTPANGNYDLTFTLFGLSNGGTAIAGPLTNSPTGVTNGLFAATLDFGLDAFPGADRWLEIALRTNGGGAFTTLAPRQKITSAPYAIHSANAGSAVSLSGPVSAAQLTGTISSTNIGAGTIGPNQLARRYLSGSVPYSAIPSIFQFNTTIVDQPVNFAVPFTTNPIITLTIDTAHPALPSKGSLLIGARSTNGFTMRVPTAAVGVEVTLAGTGLGHRPTIRTVNGNPAMVGLGQIGFSIGLVYSRSSDATGGNWPGPVLLATGYLSGSALDTVAGRPAITFLDAAGGVSYVRANDANGASWPAATQIITPAVLGGGAQLLSGGLINGRPALLVANYTTNVFYLRANDDLGSSWGAPTTVFTSSNYINAIVLAVVAGQPAYAVIAPYTTSFPGGTAVYFARAGDADGTAWPAATVAVPPNMTNDVPTGNLSLLDIAGKPAVGFVAQAGYLSLNSTIFFAQSTDTGGTSWGLPQSISTASSSVVFTAFTMIGGAPAVASTRDGFLHFVQSLASGPNFIFGTPGNIEPAAQTCTLEVVGGQPAIGFYGSGSLRFIRQGTPPPNSAVNWIAVEP